MSHNASFDVYIFWGRKPTPHPHPHPLLGDGLLYPGTAPLMSKILHSHVVLPQRFRSLYLTQWQSGKYVFFVPLPHTHHRNPVSGFRKVKLVLTIIMFCLSLYFQRVYMFQIGFATLTVSFTCIPCSIPFRPINATASYVENKG